MPRNMASVSETELPSHTGHAATHCGIVHGLPSVPPHIPRVLTVLQIHSPHKVLFPLHGLLYPPLLHTVMQSFPWVTLIDCLAVSLFLHLFVTFRDHWRRRGLPYPPGPPPFPVIGNLLDVPKRSAWVAYQTMSEKYGRATFL